MKLIKIIIINIAVFFSIYAQCGEVDVKLWEISNNKIVFNRSLAKFHAEVEKIIDPFILLQINDETLEIYNLNIEKTIKKIRKGEWSSSSYELSSDLKIIYPGYSLIKEISFETGQEKNYLKSGIGYSLEGVKLNEKSGLLATFDEAKLDLWSIKTKKKIKSIKNPDCSITDICFTPDGKFIITSDRIGNIYFRDINTLKVIKQFKHWEKDYEAVLAIAISPDGKYLASGGTTNKLINIWDINTRKIIKVLKGHTSVIYSLEFSPDGSKLLSASGLSDDLGTTDDKIKLWDVKTGKVIDEIKIKNDEAYRAAFVGNGKHIVTWVDLMTSVRDYGD